MEKINLREKLRLFREHWQPHRVAELNDHEVKVAKVLGEFDWHHHEAEDELFLVVHGRLRLDFRDRQVWLEPGELMVVPRGVEHRPVAPEEAHIVLIEPTGTRNTGNLENERTVEVRPI